MPKAMIAAATIRLKPGQKVKEAITEYVAQNKWQAGCILSAVGSLTQYNLRFANCDSGTRANGHFEVVSLTGLVSIHGCHLHMSVSDSTGKTTGGHLLDDNVVYTTLEIVLGEVQGEVHLRSLDTTYGYKELQVVLPN
ncbi:MAG: DNA-binding protein [Chitinophagaceae bacterium]|nr:DNA-binding protein [Chitinophagaceae bacterium]